MGSKFKIEMSVFPLPHPLGNSEATPNFGAIAVCPVPRFLRIKCLGATATSMRTSYTRKLTPE